MAYVTSQELQTHLEQLAQEMGISVQEVLEGYIDLDTYQIDKAAIEARLDAIDVIDAEDGIESLAEKIKAINEVLENDTGELASVFDKIVANQQAIEAERLRAEQAESGLQDAIDTESSARANADNDLQDQINALELGVAEAAGSGLATGVICGKKAANKFRAVFSQMPIDTTSCNLNGGTETGGDGDDGNMGDGGAI